MSLIYFFWIRAFFALDMRKNEYASAPEEIFAAPIKVEENYEARLQAVESVEMSSFFLFSGRKKR